METKDATLTPDDLPLLPKPGNALHELIKTAVFEIFTEYRLRTRSGRAFAETQFTLRADRARIPDVAWVSEDRLSQIPRGNQAIGIAPDLAVEIIADSDFEEDTQQKLVEYLESGVEVWQVFPTLETVTVWRGNQGTRLAGSQMIVSEALPNFSVPVSEIFRR